MTARNIFDRGCRSSDEELDKLTAKLPLATERIQ
jgi:hypothetical protein